VRRTIGRVPDRADRLSRLSLIPVAHVIYRQGRKLRRDTPRLPNANEPWSGVVAGPDPIRLLVLGDSTAAGVGAETQDAALPGNLARVLAARFERGVTWRTVGENGATTRDLLERHLPDATAEPADLVFLSVGANDALAIRSRTAFARDLARLLGELRRANPRATLLVSSMPGFDQFELLPEPLRGRLFRHSRALERAGRAVTERLAGVAMSSPAPTYTDGFFATDLFHPGPQGYREWAQWWVDDAAAAGALLEPPRG
jgi:lysophospholipase L1-like esterase